MKLSFPDERYLQSISNEKLVPLAKLGLKNTSFLMDIFFEATQRELIESAIEIKEIFEESRKRELENELVDMEDEIRRIEKEIDRREKSREIFTFADTAKKIRHSEVVLPKGFKDAKELNSSELAEHSPLALLGYRVGTNGLSHQYRVEFLNDFFQKAELPTFLPVDYLNEWGAAGSRKRLVRMIKHLRGLIIARRRNDPFRYEVAISEWSKDEAMLREIYNSIWGTTSEI